MYEKYLMSTEYGNGGIYRAKLFTIDGETDVRAYIPGINSINPFNEDDTINMPIYEKNKKTYPVIQWCSYNLESKEVVNIKGPAWVMFENGNINRPVCISYSVIGGFSSSYVSNDKMFSSPPRVVGDTVTVNWWHDTEVEYYIANGGKGTVTIKSEVTTRGLMYMNRSDWNKSCRQYKLQQKYISNYSSANGLITINGMPVVATIDFWQKGNNYVGRGIRVEFENGAQCDMIIGDVKGNIAKSSIVDYTVLNLGHLMGTLKNAINIIEYGCNSRLASSNEIISATGSEGSNTKSITLLDIDLLS